MQEVMHEYLHFALLDLQNTVNKGTVYQDSEKVKIMVANFFT